MTALISAVVASLAILALNATLGSDDNLCKTPRLSNTAETIHCAVYTQRTLFNMNRLRKQ